MRGWRGHETGSDGNELEDLRTWRVDHHPERQLTGDRRTHDRTRREGTRGDPRRPPARCLARYLKQLLASTNLHGAKVGPVSTKQGSPPRPGSDGSFGLRFIETVTLHGLHIPFYVDILGFVKGRAEVSLFTFAVLREFPAALEEQLFSQLLERAKTHSV